MAATKPYDEKDCPYCGALCFAEFVDIGVGMQQCAPFGCERCGAVQVSLTDDLPALSPRAKETGWHEPTRTQDDDVPDFGEEKFDEMNTADSETSDDIPRHGL